MNGTLLEHGGSGREKNARAKRALDFQKDKFPDVVSKRKIYLPHNFLSHSYRGVVKNSVLDIEGGIVPEEVGVQFRDILGGGERVSADDHKNVKLRGR
jgi:hypothetical protein